MAANSSHYGDINMWIEKVIDSCESLDQLTTARKLIDNFSNIVGCTMSIQHNLYCLLSTKNTHILQKITKANE